MVHRVVIGTNQACLFRDNYAAITEAGLSVFGLSTDSPKANTTFATKQKLPYQLLVSRTLTLLCDGAIILLLQWIASQG